MQDPWMIAVAGALVAFTVAMLVRNVRRKRAWNASLDGVARHYRTQVSLNEKVPQASRIDGTAQPSGHELEVEWESETVSGQDRERHYVEITVRPRSGSSLTIRKPNKHRSRQVDYAGGGSEDADWTGIAAIDERFEVSGCGRRDHALLARPEVRDALVRFVEGGGEVIHGAFRSRQRRFPKDTEALLAQIAPVMALADLWGDG